MNNCCCSVPIGTHGALWRLQLSRCSSTFNHHLFLIFSEILSTRSNSYNKLSNFHHDKLQCLIYSNEKLNAFHIQGFLFGRYRHRTIGKVDPIFFTIEYLPLWAIAMIIVFLHCPFCHYTFSASVFMVLLPPLFQQHISFIEV